LITADPLGDVLISGEGAGQLTAASGVVSDLINLASRKGSQATQMLANSYLEAPLAQIKKIDDVSTKFYIRFMATDKPGILSQITGILGNHGISINSVTQKAHNKMVAVPVIILTEYSPEKNVRMALDEIYKLGIVKVKPVAIRMENLP
jgi:homoserine dehydrogenase